ncbi:MAG: hypothetical protein ACREGF_03610, partial [Candidatus Saccharimonadales bacterium]
IRDRLGIGLVGWAYEKFKGKTSAEADSLAEKDAFNRTYDPAAESSIKDSEVDKTNQAATSAETSSINNPNSLDQLAQNNGSGGLGPEATKAIEQGTSSGTFDTIASYISTVVAIALPVCMIYSGSVQNSGPTINAQNQELQKEFYATASQADQQKYGNTNAQAVGATNWKLNGATLNNSNAMLKANGQPVDTSSEISPQAGANGQFSRTGSNIFTAILGRTLGEPVSFLAGIACKPITSKYSIAGLILLGAGVKVVGALTGGEVDVAEAGAQTAVGKIIGKIAEKFTLQSLKRGGKAVLAAPKNVFQKLLHNIKDLKNFKKGGNGRELGKIGGIVGGTVLANIIVASSSGLAHNGTATGVQYDNAVDMGANLNANATERQEFYGRPLLQGEIKASDQADQGYIAAQFKQQSPYQRYFALSNNQSLFSHLAVSLYGTIYGKPIFSSFSSLVTRVMNPISMLPQMFGSLNRNTVAAAGSGDNQHYNIIQWGYSPT